MHRWEGESDGSGVKRERGGLLSEEVDGDRTGVAKGWGVRKKRRCRCRDGRWPKCLVRFRKTATTTMHQLKRREERVKADFSLDPRSVENIGGSIEREKDSYPGLRGAKEVCWIGSLRRHDVEALRGVIASRPSRISASSAIALPELLDRIV